MAKRKKSIKPPAGFTRRSFRDDAKPISVYLGTHRIGQAEPVEHSTGSLGHRLTTKLQMRIGNSMVWVQTSLVMTVIGSKELPVSDLQQPPGGPCQTPSPSASVTGRT